jgi:hypothetical protein
VKRRRDVQDVVGHQRRRLKAARADLAFGHGAIHRPPGPRELEIRDIGGGDVRRGRVLRLSGVGAPMRPLHHGSALSLKPQAASYRRRRNRASRFHIALSRLRVYACPTRRSPLWRGDERAVLGPRQNVLEQQAM